MISLKSNKRIIEERAERSIERNRLNTSKKILDRSSDNKRDRMNERCNTRDRSSEGNKNLKKSDMSWDKIQNTNTNSNNDKNYRNNNVPKTKLEIYKNTLKTDELERSKSFL